MSAVTDAEAAILALLAERAEGATICPSEAARRIDPVGWRGAMPSVHEAVRGLAGRGAVAVTQGGRVVDAEAAVGAYRVRKPPADTPD
ncbi:MAG TPA: DUF3253 domain-containing protein [Sphingomonadaceae bacterium]|nr:DUF3253 domain-containing protein [Sphingomonadaceae bacterium]